MFNLDFNPTLRQGMLVAAFSLAAAMQAAPVLAATDPVVLTFSTVGDSRQDPQGPDSSQYIDSQYLAGNCPISSGTGTTPNPGLTGQDCKWLVNSKAWSKIMRTIQTQKANLLFFNGDMIMGYGKAGVPVTRNSTGTSEATIANPAVSDIVTSDLMQFYQQYGFWRGMVANLMETGTYVVPVPGNHEVQCKRCNKTAQVENENAWRDNMGDLILDQTRLNSILTSSALSLSNPSTSGPAINATGANGGDKITTDQTQLSYSFDIGTNHFAIINTDPVGNDTHAPTAWLDADLHAAAGRGAQHLYVFGHKPAYFYYYNHNGETLAPSSASALALKDSAAATTFWNVINNHNATYFSGHEHIYNVSQPNGQAAYQVIVGAGGSPFDDFSSAPHAPVVTPDTVVPTDRYYSWATVKIFQSGKVQMDTYGFDETLTNPVVKLGTFTLPNTAQ